MRNNARPAYHKVPRPYWRVRLRSYNQHPLLYDNILAMTEDLNRIADLGFSHVWVNPLFEPCQNADWVADEITRSFKRADITSKKPRVYNFAGSPYATRSLNLNPNISAHTNEDISKEEREKRDNKDVRRYTDKARSLNIVPLCDFVMRHVAADHPIISSPKHQHWFKRHPNGNYCFFNRDENYRPSGQTWDDVIELNYDDPVARREIIDTYLKPMAEKVINRWGFEGLRIDYAGRVPRDVYAEIIPFIDQLCMKKWGKPAQILGETLGHKIEEYMPAKGYMDWVYNWVYFAPFTKDFWQNDNTDFSRDKGILQNEVAPTIGFAGSHDVKRIAGYYLSKQHIRGEQLKEEIYKAGLSDRSLSIKLINIFWSLNDRMAFRDQKELLHKIVDEAHHNQVLTDVETMTVHKEIREKHRLTSRKAVDIFFRNNSPSTENGQAFFKALVDTVFVIVEQEREKTAREAYTGNKTPKLITEKTMIELLPESLPKGELSRKIREGFYYSAFASDGGWFFYTGDEWGTTKDSKIFETTPNDLSQRAYEGMDFSSTVRSINAVLAELPAPANPEWVQRCFLEDPEKDRALVSFLIHQGQGFTERPHLIICNSSDERQTINSDLFRELMSANGRNNTPEKNQFPKQVYICGDIAISDDLANALECMNIGFFNASTPKLSHDALSAPRPHMPSQRKVKPVKGRPPAPESPL